jgi:cell division protein FtsI (penicillin-binding protein 3)
VARRLYRASRRPAQRVVHAESRAHRARELSRGRLLSVIAVLSVCFVSLALRLIEVSLIGGGELPFRLLVSQPQLLLQMQERGEQAMAVSAEYPRRAIVDRNGLLLATNVPTADLAANPRLIVNPKQVAAQLAAVLEGVNAQRLEAQLSQPNTFTYIKRQMTPAEQQAVHALGIPGLFYETGMRRVYPAGELAAHVVGYVDVDNQGLAGIEQSMNNRLRFAGGGGGEDAPLQLSIDLRVQALLAKELAATMQRFHAVGAAGVVMDVHSGEVLGLASLPSYDPHRPASADDDARFNRASLGLYELGSTFKTFMVAMGLDKGVITPKDGFDISRPIRLAGIEVKDDDPIQRWANIQEIFAYSSNIGTVKIVQQAGFDEQVRFFEKIGFMQPVGFELPERAAPQTPAVWRPANHATAAYGYAMSVTPLHMARATAAMVNGGILPEVTLMKREKADKQKGKRIIRAQTSAQIREMMRLTVDYGTARKAQVEGYSVGGKTGTSEKIINGRYAKNKKITSFVSAFPMENPRYVVFVMIDEPHGNKDTQFRSTGGWMAAPTAANIIQRVGPLLGVQPRFEMANSAEVEFWKKSRETRQRPAMVRQSPPPPRDGGLHAASF